MADFDEVAVGVERERPRARVEQVIAIGDHEEAVALDGDVGVAVGRLDRALQERRRDAADGGAEADLDRVDAALVAARRGARAERLAQDVLEDDRGGLEARGVGSWRCCCRSRRATAGSS